jgi:hypothetical protein
MAKARGPLFSIGASGTVADLLTFNPGKDSTNVRRTPKKYPPPTTPQQVMRAKMQDAATSWRALSPTDKAEWSTLANNHGRLPFAKYLIEWMAQASTIDTPPFIPME